MSIHSEWDPQYVNLNTSLSTDDIGKLGFRKIWTYLGILVRTSVLLVFRRPNLVYIAMTVKNGGFFKDLILITMIKFMRVPIVYHLHNKGVANCQDRWPYRYIYPWVFHRSRVILLSKYLYNDIARYVKNSATYYCPNGIPDTARLFIRHYETNRVPIILFLSNLMETKGVNVLLQACAILKDRGIAYRTEFVGDEGDLTAETFISTCKELKITDRVMYLGHQYGADKDAAYKRADIFCLPTYQDCLPLVLLEAMQWRLPIVSTQEGGVPDLVQDGVSGFLVRQRNALVLADRLETLLYDPDLRRRMGEAGRLRYVDNFTEQQFAATLRNCLLEALAPLS
jgi:glycosyltransferase involved in cell wall biosynthesis